MYNKVVTYKKISLLLLVLCSTFFALSVFLGGYLFYRFREINLLKAQLMNKQAIQKELLNENDLDFVLYPHRKNFIGYTLNPLFKQGTLWSSDEEPYEINALGLRGPKITEKTEGVKRILLLGDSWLFGWFLKEEDRIGSQLQQLVDSKTEVGKYEVITAAIPGWNTQCEANFLKHHIHRIDPDYIIWEIMANDVLDANGVVPPGVLSESYSPQTPERTPFTTLGKLINYPMPFILSRYERNLELIHECGKQYGIPIFIFSIDVNPVFLKQISEKQDIPYPVLFLPDKYKLDKERGWLKPNDFHPTPWLTNIIATGLLKQLKKQKFIVEIDFKQDENEIAEPFQLYSDLQITQEHIEAYKQKYLTWTPSEFQTGEIQPNTGLGLVHRNKMSQHGYIYLHVPDERKSIGIYIQIEEMFLDHPHEVTFTVRDCDQKENKITMKIDHTIIQCDIPLPEPLNPYPLYEIEWKFDYCECSSPRLCYSATLMHVSSF